MKKLLLLALGALTSGALIEAKTYTFVNATPVAISLDVTYPTAFCKNDLGRTILPGQVLEIEAGSCNIDEIRAVATERMEIIDQTGLKRQVYFGEGKRTSYWAGQSATFRIYVDYQIGKLIFVREGEKECLSDYATELQEARAKK